VVSGMLSLSRYLGLLTGASGMGVVFAAASPSASSPRTVATGMRVTYAVATLLIAVALAIAVRSRTRVTRHPR
jgi:preprotein translocase subunit SecG